MADSKLKLATAPRAQRQAVAGHGARRHGGAPAHAADAVARPQVLGEREVLDMQQARYGRMQIRHEVRRYSAPERVHELADPHELGDPSYDGDVRIEHVDMCAELMAVVVRRSGVPETQVSGRDDYFKLSVVTWCGAPRVASDAAFPHRMRLRSGGTVADSRGPAPGAAGLHLVGGLPLLRPEEQVFEAMLDGWRMAPDVTPGRG